MTGREYLPQVTAGAKRLHTAFDHRRLGPWQSITCLWSSLTDVEQNEFLEVAADIQAALDMHHGNAECAAQLLAEQHVQRNPAVSYDQADVYWNARVAEYLGRSNL